MAERGKNDLLQKPHSPIIPRSPLLQMPQLSTMSGDPLSLNTDVPVKTTPLSLSHSSRPSPDFRSKSNPLRLPIWRSYSPQPSPPRSISLNSCPSRMHKHLYIIGGQHSEFVLTGESLQRHIDVMGSRDLKAVSRYKEEVNLERVLRIEYYSCPNRSECFKELQNLNHQTLESIKCDDNEENQYCNKYLEKIMPDIHRHVCQYPSGPQEILFGTAKYPENIFFSLLIQEIYYYCCPHPFICVQELQNCRFPQLELVRGDNDTLATLESVLPKRHRANMKLIPHMGTDSNIHGVKTCEHKHIYQNYNMHKHVLSGFRLQKHLCEVQSKNNQSMKQYIKDMQLDEVAEIEYVSCPDECIWQKELEYFLMLVSVKCDRDIRFAIKPVVPEGISLEMPKYHMHVYQRTDNSKLVLTGDILQKHIVGVSPKEKKKVERFLHGANLKNVAGVEYYACPDESMCVKELSHLLSSQLRSVKSDRDISQIIRPMLSDKQRSNIRLTMPGVHRHVYKCDDGREINFTKIATRKKFRDVRQVEWYSCTHYPNCNNELGKALYKHTGLHLVCMKMYQLKVLKIQNVALGKLPASIGNLKHLEHLSASHCDLAEISDSVGALGCLKYLILFGNQNLIELPSSLGNLTQLEFVDLRKCGFKVFPGTLINLCQETVIRMTDNPIQVISKEDIRTMIHLRKKLKEVSPAVPISNGITKIIGKLIVTFQSPSSPPEIVLQSDHLSDWLNYFDECKVSAMTKQCTLKNVVVLGQTGAGKSSLMRSLAHGIAQKAPRDDRTVVLDELVYADVENKIQFNITDFGGHEIYEVCYPIFLTSGNKICVVAVDIKEYISSSKDERVIKWLEMAINYMASGDVKIVATKADMCSETELEKNLECLNKDIKHWKANWLQFCEIVIDKKTSNNHESVDLDMTQIERLYKLQEWISQLDLTPITTSVEDAMGFQSLAKSMNQNMEGSKQVIPEGWFNTLQKLKAPGNVGKKTLAFDELKGIYYRHGASYDLDMDTDDDPKSDCSLDTTDQKCKEFLHYLHNAGLVLWFHKSKPLEKVVFHDREFLVHILQHIFHHKLRETLKYNPAAPHFQSLTDFNDHLDKFLDCGILSETLLLHIWDQTEHSGNKDLLSYIMELLQALNLCFQMRDTSHSWHFPWFVKMEDNEAFFKKDWSPIIRQSEIGAEFCYKFCRRLPLMIYEQLSVAIQRNVYPGDIRHDWKDIIYIRSNGVQMKIQRFSYERHPTIQVSLRTQLSNIQAMYELCLRVNVDLQTLLYTCPGVVYDSYLVCPHCLLIGAPNKKHWNLSLIEDFAKQDWMTCPATTPAVGIPSAMVYFMTLGKYLTSFIFQKPPM